MTVEIDPSVFPERTTVSLPDTARRVVLHRHRRGRAQRIGHRRPGGRRPRRARAASTGSASFDPSKYDTQLAGEVEGFEPESYIEKRLMVQTDRWTWMALAATQMAFEDAKFDPEEQDPWTMGVVTASSSGGNEFGQREIQALWEKGPGFVGAYQSIAWFYAATTGQISIKHGMKGTCGVIVSEGTGGLEALQHSRRVIRRGRRARRQRRARGADRSLCHHLPDAQRLPQQRARPGGGVPSLRRAGQRLRARRGRRDPDARDARAGEGARRTAGLRGARRLRRDERRPPLRQAGAGRQAVRARDAASRWRTPASARTTSTSSSPTAPAPRRPTRSRPRRSRRSSGSAGPRCR